jgi:hypothetical protein
MAASQSPSPHDARGSTTDSRDSLLFDFDGPGDTTRRPARPNLPPPYWTGHRPSPTPPPNDQPPKPTKGGQDNE